MIAMKYLSCRRGSALMLVLTLLASSWTGPAWSSSSPWVEGPNAKVRLISGSVAQESGALMAFVEIVLEPGWKTYWRTPGDAGGLPPEFDWSQSVNLAKANVQFPAPQRFTDRSGNTIGYEDGVIFPIVVTPLDGQAPVGLRLGLHYGICKDVCVPIDAELALDIDPTGSKDTLSGDVLDAVDRVPRTQDKARPGDPVFMSATGILDGASPKITISARFPGGAEAASAFIEAPDGLYLPLPERSGAADGEVLAFEVDLSKDVDLAGLKGKPVTITMVGETGASVATFLIE